MKDFLTTTKTVAPPISILALLLVTNGLFVYQLFKLVELDASVTAEEKEELEIRKTPALFTGFNLHLYNFPL